MKILCVGDICGTAGCTAFETAIAPLKRQLQADLVIVNGENSADGNGILPSSAKRLFDAGADVITGGNHTLRRVEIHPELDENSRLLRPANLPDSVPGSGYTLIDCGRLSVCVINLLGTVYLDSNFCPFRCADAMIDKAKAEDARIILVDFHAEATSEKRAMGFYLDGRASAVFGTHTHVQTADEHLLPKGTAYITDIGMTGPIQSVLGVKYEAALARMKDKMPARFSIAEGPYALSGALFEFDDKTGAAVSVTRINLPCQLGKERQGEAD